MTMRYSAFIFVTKDQLLTMNLEKNGKCEKIPIEGNASMQYRTADDVVKYFRYVKEYYNISNFSDLDMSVTAVNLTQKVGTMWSVMDQIKDAQEINCLTGEKIIPLVVCLKGIIKDNNKITMSILNTTYEVECLLDGTFSCNATMVTSTDIDLTPEDFASCFNFNKKMFGESERKLQKIYEEKKKVENLFEEERMKVENLNVRLENEQNKLQKLKETLQPYLRNEYREIIKCETDGSPYGARIHYLVDSATFVKKGAQLVEIITGFSERNLVIEAQKSGRFFCLKKEGEFITEKRRNDIGILGNKNDTEEEVLTWYYGPKGTTKKDTNNESNHDIFGYFSKIKEVHNNF